MAPFYLCGHADRRKIMEFLMSSRFEYMITYMDNKRIPRSGNIENLIYLCGHADRSPSGGRRNLPVRHADRKVRRGFKTEKGKQNHLKLYQVKHYLDNELAENSGKMTTP
ncbi:MAG: hypothetical protein AB1488_00345 [Nitrospirota bacterium]